MRAKTSFQALFLTVRPTVEDSNAARARFNALPILRKRSFALACCSHCPLLCLRVMPFSFHGISIAPVIVVLLLFCSCEKHRVGELPDVQKEHVDLAAQSAKNSSPSSERSTSPSPTLTPAEFFPATKPR